MLSTVTKQECFNIANFYQITFQANYTNSKHIAFIK